jgi:uncharacterized damage-inducible protein DinB
MPAGGAGERASLEAWLDFYRATLASKCEGLTEAQLRAETVAPSPLTLLGLIQHMTEVERSWFRRVVAGEELPRVYVSPEDPDGDAEGFRLYDEVSSEAALAAWQDEIARGQANCAKHGLEDTFTGSRGGRLSLRWIYTHMIAEYARHAGHADFLRERIDGSTGF